MSQLGTQNFVVMIRGKLPGAEEVSLCLGFFLLLMQHTHFIKHVMAKLHVASHPRIDVCACVSESECSPMRVYARRECTHRGVEADAWR